MIEPPHCIPRVPGLRCGDLGLLALYAAVLVLLFRWFKRENKAGAAAAEHEEMPEDTAAPLLADGWHCEPGADLCRSLSYGNLKSPCPSRSLIAQGLSPFLYVQGPDTHILRDGCGSTSDGRRAGIPLHSRASW